MKTEKYKKQEKENKKVTEPAVAFSYNYSDQPLTAHSILGVNAGAFSEPLNRVDTFRKGLQKNSFEKLKEITGLDNNTLAAALGVSSKTIQRKQIFDVIQSEKMYELADLYATGVSYFGEDGFRRWMNRPLFSIGNRKPIELIDVNEGIVLLKAEILRLQHGIAI
jgi:putative toxin-antitoxin system antitoxin component (TIGR02293 family)